VIGGGATAVKGEADEEFRDQFDPVPLTVDGDPSFFRRFGFVYDPELSQKNARILGLHIS